MTWTATCRDLWATTIGESEALPFFIVVSQSGIVLERDDGEVREFRTLKAAERAADALNAGREP